MEQAIVKDPVASARAGSVAAAGCASPLCQLLRHVAVHRVDLENFTSPLRGG